jgi:hypothetical protein
MLKMTSLPRQARDKHRESTQKEERAVLSQEVDELLLIAMPLAMARIFCCHTSKWFRAHSNLVVHDNGVRETPFLEPFSS